MIATARLVERACAPSYSKNGHASARRLDRVHVRVFSPWDYSVEFTQEGQVWLNGGVQRRTLDRNEPAIAARLSPTPSEA